MARLFEPEVVRKQPMKQNKTGRSAAHGYCGCARLSWLRLLTRPQGALNSGISGRGPDTEPPFPGDTCCGCHNLLPLSPCACQLPMARRVAISTYPARHLQVGRAAYPLTPHPPNSPPPPTKPGVLAVGGRRRCTRTSMWRASRDPTGSPRARALGVGRVGVRSSPEGFCCWLMGTGQ